MREHESSLAGATGFWQEESREKLKRNGPATLCVMRHDEYCDFLVHIEGIDGGGRERVQAIQFLFF
jgi:hypothetical protein